MTTIFDTTDFDPGDEDDHRRDFVHDDPDPCPMCGAKVRSMRAWLVPVPRFKRDAVRDITTFIVEEPFGYEHITVCDNPVCRTRAKKFAELQQWSPETKLRNAALWRTEREADPHFDWMKSKLSRVF